MKMMNGIFGGLLACLCLDCSAKDNSVLTSPVRGVSHEKNDEVDKVGPSTPENPPVEFEQGGEMLGAPGITDDDIPGVESHFEDSALSNLPSIQTKDEMLDFCRKSMNEKNWDQVIAATDIATLMYPKDLEILEFRGLAQIAKGNFEDGKQDLNRCCKKGRASCCQNN